MLAAKQKAGLSRVHVEDLQKRLTAFAAAFPIQPASLTPTLVKQYLDGLMLSDGSAMAPRTKRNVLRCVSGLLHFARKKKFVTRELVDEISVIELPKSKVSEVGVFTTAQLTALLAAADPEMVAPIAIEAFAGLRNAEICRLDWKNPGLSERIIVVGAHPAKTAQRRIVPISDNLAAWLAPHAREAGSVNSSPTVGGFCIRLNRGAARPSGVPWIHNGLRHSLFSYRLAVTHDPSRVATEAGNSPAMVHRQYKALVTEAEGRAWFRIEVAYAMNADRPIICCVDAEASPREWSLIRFNHPPQTLGW